MKPPVLHNINRNAVQNCIEIHPGLHKIEIMRRLDVGMGTVVHHLRVLEKSRLISVYRFENGYPHYFSHTRTREGEKAIIVSLRDNIEARIMLALIGRSDLTHHELCSRPELRTHAVAVHMRKLIAKELVVERKAAGGKYGLYSLAKPDLVQELIIELKESLSLTQAGS